MAYTTICKVRDYGITHEIARDSKITAYIAKWEAAIDKYCGQWFESRNHTIVLDGPGNIYLHLPLPVISVTSLYINDETTATNTDKYVVYNDRTQLTNDRDNPKIVLKEGYFKSGFKNQKIVGSFGYTESDDSTPAPIVEAATMLIVEKLLEPTVITADFEEAIESAGIESAIGKGSIREEATDGHSWSYNSTTTEKRPSFNAITKNPEVIDLLNMYKRKNNQAIYI